MFDRAVIPAKQSIIYLKISMLQGLSGIVEFVQCKQVIFDVLEHPQVGYPLGYPHKPKPITQNLVKPRLNPTACSCPAAAATPRAAPCSQPCSPCSGSRAAARAQPVSCQSKRKSNAWEHFEGLTVNFNEFSCCLSSF